MTTAILFTEYPATKRTWAGQDMALGLASLDLNPQLLLAGPAILLLAPNHDCFRDSEQQRQSLHKRFRILELFDCPAVWVSRNDLELHQLNPDDLVLPVQVIEDDEWALQLQLLPSILRY
ncbi:hypothetical protein CWE22_02320 [Pseudidiomarina aestuarii]|uniref:Sulfurtransferase complex subunit TusC n=1 Tax=Pseudidiomarina aestuarii TaxID=624146 RepID=A0A7Z7ETG9_9GAMM|nr:hypothetical protein [Pseudidiomarina aestuarii]RUO41047.1 hypothetical protein CWE22_02320 [Pseudidiomarina aestuarii]